MSKIQILKAIHNGWLLPLNVIAAVSDVKDTNFESNSQQRGRMPGHSLAVSDVKDTNFESNSQCSMIGVKVKNPQAAKSVDFFKC